MKYILCFSLFCNNIDWYMKILERKQEGSTNGKKRYERPRKA